LLRIIESASHQSSIPSTALRLRITLGAVGGFAAIVAASLAPRSTERAAAQSWPPFLLVAALLAIGVVAHRDGFFDAAAHRLLQLPGGGPGLLVWLLGLVAVVTVVLNLDTSAAFLTPVVILTARRRGIRPEAFLYGALLMSNAASLLLPGSNLTNLMVLAHEHVSGGLFAARMFPAWLAAVMVTAAFLLVTYRASLETGSKPVHESWPPVASATTVAALVVATVLVVALSAPALPVAAVAVAVVLWRAATSDLRMRDAVEAVDPLTLSGLFGVAVGLGALARSWDGPAHLMAHASGPATSALGAVSAIVFNNLPAAVLLSSRAPAHPRALLLGLNLGPNLAVTGSLSALVWYRAARAVGERPRALQVSRLGLVLVPLSLATSVGALALFAPGKL
jgi:arsenical pump membrane protein